MCIIKCMKQVIALPPPKLQQPKLYWIALVYAGLVVLTTTYLLFYFDKIIEAIAIYNIGGGAGGLAMLVCVATAGVLSLTYLLRMTVSPLMRVVGLVCAFLAPLGWLLGAWWIELHLGRGEALVPMIVAHTGVLGALASVWVVGLPFKPLKKKR